MPFWKKEEEKKIDKTISFADLLTGLQKAISQVQDMLQNNQLQNLRNFWDSEGKPVSQTVKVGDKIVDVPLMTLVPHSQLAMDTVKIDFSVRIGHTIPTETHDLLKSGTLLKSANNTNDFESISVADIQVAMDGAKANNDDAMKVCITFKIKDTPEAISRIMDEYNKEI